MIIRPMTLGASLLAGAATLLTSTVSMAEELCPVSDEPRVTVSPGTIYVTGSGPWSEDLLLTVDLIDNIPSYNSLDVKFDGDLAYSGEKAPGHNICTNQTGGTGTCSVGGAENEVVIAYTATFEALGSYSVEVSAEKSGPNDVCETAYLSVVEFLSVEFKAPPAIANEYINAHYSDLSGKRRGCVISKIASHHAKESKYGAKGGDAELYPETGYDVGAIYDDVDYYFITSCTK
ncbi:hypothetical protein [Zobellella sp. DQSA1]|uniref:hypothetical protein n=1 Tax=Zobellella sp. DQSA1 TaxID=3342386 RepID=UPI0035BF98EE